MDEGSRMDTLFDASVLPQQHQRGYLGRKRIPLQQTVVLALLTLQLPMVELMIQILVMLLLKSC